MHTQLTTRVNVKLTVHELLLTYDAMTDKLYIWRSELRLRAKNGSEIGGLQRNYDELMDARDQVRDVLATHGYQRN